MSYISKRYNCNEVFMYSKETLIKIVLLALLIYSVTGLARVRAELREASALQETLNTGLCELRKENALLRERADIRNSEDEMARLAREKFALVFPGEKIFYFIDREE